MKNHTISTSSRFWTGDTVWYKGEKMYITATTILWDARAEMTGKPGISHALQSERSDYYKAEVADDDICLKERKS